MSQNEVLWKPHPGKQTEFSSRLEDVVLYGGAKGGGKTDAILAEALRQVHIPGYQALIVRRTFPQLQECIDRAHKIYPKLKAKWVGAIHRYIFPSGAYVEFGHCQNESDKERYQGHEYAFLGYDQLEQFTESQYNFITAQNRTSNPKVTCYIRCTANPGGVGHWWIKRRFIDSKTAGKTYEVNYPLPGGKTVSRTSCYIPATVYDNPTLLAANPTYLANLMSLPEIERRAYLHGDWNAFTTQCVFDANGMQRLDGKIMYPKWIGMLRASRENFQIIPIEEGNLHIWKTPDPTSDYMIAADVAEGDETGDYSAIHVIDKRTWEQAAEWHGHCTPFELAQILYDLGYYYNEAKIAIEKPGPGGSTVEKIVELGYSNLYHYNEDKVGYLNNIQTRTNMLATLMDSVKDGSVIIRSRETLDEMFNLVRNPKTMKIEAREGCHDDRVLSLAICLQCIRVDPFYEPIRKGMGNSPLMVQSIRRGNEEMSPRRIRRVI